MKQTHTPHTTHHAPSRYSPMLAKLGTDSDLKLPKFTYEEKLDGTRAILYKNNSKIKLINRRNNNVTHRYPEFNFSKSIKSNCALDGEIVIFNKKGISEFNLLQHRDLLEDKEKISTRSKTTPATFVAFDILELNSKKLTTLPQKERFRILKKTVSGSKHIKLVKSSKNGKKLFQTLIKKGGEGVIAKNPEEKYYQGKRRKAWIKIKKSDTIDGIIIGYTQEKRKLSTLLLAAYSRQSAVGGRHLIYIGKLGTGFSEEEQTQILSKLEKIKTNKPTIPNLPKNTIFVKPKLIAKAKYLEITKAKKLRAPVFVKMRTDKKLKDCII